MGICPCQRYSKKDVVIQLQYHYPWTQLDENPEKILTFVKLIRQYQNHKQETIQNATTATQLYDLGICCRILNDFKESILFLSQAGEKGEHEAYRLLGDYYSTYNYNYNLAIQWYTRYEEFCAGPYVSWRLGEVYLRGQNNDWHSQKWERGLKYLKSACTSSVWKPWVHTAIQNWNYYTGSACKMFQDISWIDEKLSMQKENTYLKQEIERLKLENEEYRYSPFPGPEHAYLKSKANFAACARLQSESPKSQKVKK